MAAMMAALVAIALAVPARAQVILRDPDIEYALKQLARPVIEASGLSAGRLKVLVIKDDSLNAFVADHDHVFLHSGLILRLKEPEELQAVIAHELAHIANGHLSRRAANYRAARNTALMGTILAGIAAAAGGGGKGGAAGVAVGGVQSSAQRSFFAHTRAEEASADQSALRYMAAAGIDPPNGMNEVLELFRGQEALSVGRRDPYALTHPLNRDRIRAVAGFVAGHQHRAQERPEDKYWFARAQGKLSAFLRAPATTFRAVGRKPGQGDIVARMRRAVAFHRQPKPDKAIAEIQALVAAYPNDPYLAELQGGQILLESRKFGGAAVQAYRRAAQKAPPSNGLILAGYGRALLAQNTGGASNAEALKVLTRARSRDPPYSPLMLRDLGLAYARAGNNGMAALMSAERYALIGRLKDAVPPHAKRAEGLLPPRGSSGWNRAQDILTAARAVSNDGEIHETPCICPCGHDLSGGGACAGLGCDRHDRCGTGRLPRRGPRLSAGQPPRSSDGSHRRAGTPPGAEAVANDSAMIAHNADELFNDGYSHVAGNPDGDITLVEFVDYRCGYCRKAFPELKALVETDGNIRVIYKEFPILGEGSTCRRSLQSRPSWSPGRRPMARCMTR